jgi:hypothetical protein
MGFIGQEQGHFEVLPIEPERIPDHERLAPPNRAESIAPVGEVAEAIVDPVPRRS